MKVLLPYDYARKRVIYCWLEEPVSIVSKRFVEENVGSMIVDDEEGKHVGMLTDAVLFKAVSAGVDVSKMKVKGLKYEPLVTASIHADVDEVMGKFKDTLSERIALVDEENRIAGILKKKNIDRFAMLNVGGKLAEK